MRRRWRLWLGLALLLAVGRVCVHPVGFWPIYGWVRGDAFYRGKPVSYWAAVIDTRNRLWYESQGRWRQPGPTWIDHLEESTGLDLQRKWTLRPESLPFDDTEDAEAVPVLVDLLKHERVANYAAWKLQQLGPKAAPAVPRLLKLAVEEEDWRALDILEIVDSEAAARAMELRQHSGRTKKPRFPGTRRETATLRSTENSTATEKSR